MIANTIVNTTRTSLRKSLISLERAAGIEPATFSLGSCEMFR